jgi:hypothetical protein
LEREHLDVVVVGCSAATTRRTGWSEGHATTGAKVCGAKPHVGSAGAWGKEVRFVGNL